MSIKWIKEHSKEKRALDARWRAKNPRYMSDYNKLLKLYTKGKIKLQIGEGLMDYRWMLKAK